MAHGRYCPGECGRQPVAHPALAASHGGWEMNGYPLLQVSLCCLNPPHREDSLSVRLAAVFVLCSLGCSSASLQSEASDDYGFEPGSRHVWVRGPWADIEPSSDVDSVIDQLCPAVMRLPRARERDYGQEYCGLIYSLGDGVFYASKGSPLGETQLVGASKRKSCFSPRRVVDGRGRTVPMADFHSHPWSPSPMSPKDRQSGNQRWFIRIQFDTSCHLQKLIPHVGETRPGEVYERVGKKWELVGLIRPEDKSVGRITAIESVRD